MTKILQATLKTPFIMASIDLETSDELTRASIIQSARRQMVYEMRKALEKKMAELSEDDMKFELIEESK